MGSRSFDVASLYFLGLFVSIGWIVYYVVLMLDITFYFVSVVRVLQIFLANICQSMQFSLQWVVNQHAPHFNKEIFFDLFTKRVFRRESWADLFLPLGSNHLRCSIKKVFDTILQYFQNSQEYAYNRVSSLIKVVGLSMQRI